MEGNKLEEMIKKVEVALSGTQNSSAPGPDGISYGFIKTIKDTTLGERVLEEVARNLIKEIISRKWQNSKVVIISKPGKDHEKTKGWRPINLINCIGKLEEKVVADGLQGCGLLHKHQFRSVKRRLAMEAAQRTATRAQRCIAKGGVVGWGFWDIKGGFQNVKEEDVIRELEKLEEGKNWIPWIRGFFRARRFELEWEGKTRGKGKTNLGAPQGLLLSPIILLI